MGDSTREWVRLAMLAELEEGCPALRKLGDRRFVCVRRGERVSVLDDRCPHQGYPLSQGTVRGGELTCQWHNWKFDLDTGACSFGGEGAERFPTKVEDGVVFVDPAIDPEALAGKLRQSIAAALADGDTSRTVRESLRLGRATGDPTLGGLGAGFEALLIDCADRAEYGFDHALAMTSDLMTWIDRGWVGAAEALAVAAAAAGEANRNLPRRSYENAEPSPNDPMTQLLDALLEERREEVESLARAAAHASAPADLMERVLVPFVARHLLDYGHGAIFATKGLEIGRRFPTTFPSIAAALGVSLAHATAETLLPPFTATRKALESLAAAGPSPVVDTAPLDRPQLEQLVLEGESKGVAAVAELLRSGVAPRRLLVAIAHAAAERLSRFDARWERDPLAEVSILDVTHAVTFAEAAIALLDHASPATAGALALQAAGFVGKLRRADAATAPVGVPTSEPLRAVAEARDLGAALGAASSLDRAARIEAYRELADYAAFDAAVRPIRVAHAVKVLEALYRLERADPEADGTYLRALLVTIVPRRPEVAPRRVAQVAVKFLEDARPPLGLY